MAKSKKILNERKSNLPSSVKENIVDTPVSKVLVNNYMPYAMSVIVSRALPEIDGFKPAHRKLLYTMYKMGLLGSTRTKSANIVGQTMKLNPHGDSAIYETMVRLTKSNESLLCPLVDSKGNFGKHYSRDMAYAASRYTEAKLTKICSEFFQSLDKNAVDMIDNYDGTMKEPSLLPVSFPSILTNPTVGIAVSMASNICSFNLAEVCQAAILRIKSPKKSIMEVIKAPDFSTGGDVLYNETEMKQIIDTGLGSFKVRGRYKNDEKNRIIEIYEIPYSTTAENIIEETVALIKRGYFSEIADIRDETDLNGLKIAIDYKKGTNVEDLMNRIYKNTSLEDSFGCNFNILIDGNPQVLGVTQILDEWLKWRRNCVNRVCKYELEQKEHKKMLLEGLSKIALNVNKAIKIIRESSDPDVVPNLMKGFKINQPQAEYVAEIKLRNLNKDYILERTNEIESLDKQIDNLQQTVDNNKKLNAIIVKQLEDIIKKYGVPRKTGIINASDITYSENVVEEKEYSVKIAITQKGYIKAVNPSTNTSDIKINDEDKIMAVEEVSSKAEILLFTSGQNIYKLKASSFKISKPSDQGEYLPSSLGFANEEIKGVIMTSDFKGSAILCFENGKMARIPLSVYETKTNRKKLINSISDVSSLIAVFIAPTTNIAVITSDNRGVAIPTNLIPEKTTKNTQGVQVVKLAKNETVLSCIYNTAIPKDIVVSKSIPVTPKKM